MRGWIGCDFDGTLVTQEDDRHNPNGHGQPIMPMIELVREHLRRNDEVRIFTARVWGLTGDNMMHRVDAANSVRTIQKFCQEYFGRILPITCVKDPYMRRLYDDRAIQVEKNTGRLLP